MPESFSKLVVRSYAPRRRALLLWVSGFVALGLFYSAFEWGRYSAGFHLIDSVRGALSASSRIRALEAENIRQHAQLEAAEVARRVDREGYNQVERSLGDMQAQIARLTQDLSFYRGLVQPDSVTHVKVQQMQILPQGGSGNYLLKFVLTQVGKPDNMVSGNVVLSIDGSRQGRPMSLSLADVSPKGRVSLAYSFRYFQDYAESIQLPQGFEPSRLGAQIHGGRDGSHGFVQAFVWKTQGMSVETEANGNIASKGGVDVQAQTD